MEKKEVDIFSNKMFKARNKCSHLPEQDVAMCAEL